MTVYSFKDLQLAFNSTFTGPQTFQGQLGFGRLTVVMATERTAHDTAADGNIMVSSLAGNSGHITVETQQTSFIHIFLLGWYNALIQAQNNGDVTNWATSSLSARNLTTGTSHVATGVSPSKFPDYPYAAQGEHVTWSLMCADIANG